MPEERYFLELDRVPVFIGKEGSKKKEIEDKFECEIEIDSDTGEVIISSEDALNIFIVSNIISAVNYGHNPDKALALEDENYVLDVIDVKPMVRDSGRLKVVMGRIIGKEGSTRSLIEEMTKCAVSVRDNYVSVIGPYENTLIVHEALEMLINGSSHKSFYSFLERNSVNVDSGLL